MQWEDRIGRRLKLRDVHMLLAAVQCGSMAKAAERLAVSHPVVSKTISDLEHTLGVQLLERSRQGVEPTIYGRAVLKHGLAAFDELRQCVKEIESLADPAAGEVRIGSINPLAASFTSAAVDRLAQRNLRIQFHLLSGELETLSRDLFERRLDLLVAWKIAPLTDPSFRFKPLYTDFTVVAAGANHPLARRRKIEFAQLITERWVLPPPDSSIGAVFREAFRASGLDWPRTTVIAFSHDVRTSLLATGRYLTMFRDSVMRFPTRHPDLVPLPIRLLIPGVDMGVVTLANRALSPAARLFVEQASEVARPLVKGK